MKRRHSREIGISLLWGIGIQVHTICIVHSRALCMYTCMYIVLVYTLNFVSYLHAASAGKKQQSNRAQSSIPRPPLRTKRSFFHPLCLLETPSTAECLLPNETHALLANTCTHSPNVPLPNVSSLLLLFSQTPVFTCSARDPLTLVALQPYDIAF